MYPSFQASRMQKNRNMDTPTRRPNALAMPFALASCDVPPRSMKNKAAAKLPKIRMKANITKYVIEGIIR